MASSSRSAEERVCLGEVVRPHGLDGWLAVRPIGSHPERFTRLEHVFLGETRYPVEEGKVAERGILLKLAGVDNRNAAETLRGRLIWIERSERIPLPEGEFFIDDLLGFHVVTIGGEEVGVLEAVWNQPANDVFVVRTAEGGQVLIPAIRSIVRAIEQEARRLLVEDWGVSR